MKYKVISWIKDNGDEFLIAEDKGVLELEEIKDSEQEIWAVVSKNLAKFFTQKEAIDALMSTDNAYEKYEVVRILK